MLQTRHSRLLWPLVALVAVALHGGEKEPSDRAERRLRTLESRAGKIPRSADAEQATTFLMRETQRLLHRTRKLKPASYEFDRMLEALDDLLDAREDLLSAGRPKRNSDESESTRSDTAKRLERAYFRVQQGEYFARLSADQSANEYVLRSRQLYQMGRTAYDKREYRKANKLASASSELVNVLENLAQAAVRKPDPPVLP